MVVPLAVFETLRNGKTFKYGSGSFKDIRNQSHHSIDCVPVTSGVVP